MHLPPNSSGTSKPFLVYSSINKPVMVFVIGFIALLGLAFFVTAFRVGLRMIGAEELLLLFTGLAFLYFSLYISRYVLSPRMLIERDFFCISDFFRRRTYYYEQIRALAEFKRLMRQRHYTQGMRSIPVLAIRLRSGKLIQFALPGSHDNQACLDELAKASGLVIESLGIDPPKIEQWRREN